MKKSLKFIIAVLFTFSVLAVTGSYITLKYYVPKTESYINAVKIIKSDSSVFNKIGIVDRVSYPEEAKFEYDETEGSANFLVNIFNKNEDFAKVHIVIIKNNGKWEKKFINILLPSQDRPSTN